MATEVITALGIDKQKLDGHLVVITEENGANGNFILNCVIAERVRKSSALCLVTFHNTFQHYQIVGTKFGYDLNRLLDSNRLSVIEPHKYIFDSFTKLEINTNDEKLLSDVEFLNFFDENKSDIIVKLYLQIKSNIVQLFKHRKNVCLIIDDLSHLLDLKIPMKDIIGFKQLLKFLLKTYKDLSIVINVGVTNDTDLVLANSLRHISDMSVQVSGLKTGRSSVVSGVMKVVRKTETKGFWGRQNTYHYKLLDRHIKLFAPGTVTLNS